LSIGDLTVRSVMMQRSDNDSVCGVVHGVGPPTTTLRNVVTVVTVNTSTCLAVGRSSQERVGRVALFWLACLFSLFY